MSDRDSLPDSPGARRRHRSDSNPRSRSRSPRRPVRVKSKRIIIANCPYDVSWQKLKELFREKVGYTGYLEMIESNGKQMGMGVMEFRTYEGAEKAIEIMHRYPMGDRKLVVREETPRDQERIAQFKSGIDPNQAQAQINSLIPAILQQMGIEGPATNAIYISNLDYKVTWQKIKDVFKLAGHVLNVEVKTDKDGKSRGFAVVKFEHPYEAVQAISMFNGQSFYDRPMRIKFDREGTPIRTPAILPGSSRGGPGGILGGLGGGGGGGPSGFPNIRNGGGPGGRLPDGLKSMGSGLGAGGQPLRSIQELAAMSQNTVNQSPNIGGGPPSSNMNLANNSALAGLQQLLTAAAAGGMSQEQIIAAAAAMGQGLLSNSNSGPDGGANSGRSFGGGPEPSGGPRGNVNVGNGRQSRVDSVVVRNLPFSYTWQDLKRSFSEVGEVRTAKIKTDPNTKKSLGFGFVHFYSPEDAIRSIDLLNGTRFDGRTIRVELDTK